MKQRGFTIIELSLFLAISGTLVLLTIGLWAMVARQQFQDTMTTLKSVIQTEYGEVRTSINERLGSVDIRGCEPDGTTSGDKTGNTKCLAIGKLIEFTPGRKEIKISYVVAIPENEQYLSMSDEAALREIGKGTGTGTQLWVIDDVSTYHVKADDDAVKPKIINIEWGGEFARSWTIPTSDPDPKSSSAIAILHSPVSSAVLTFALTLNNPVSNSGGLTLGDSALTNQPIAIIIKNNLLGFKGAAICLDGGASSTAVRTAIPADDYYDFGTNTTDLTKLRSLCGL